MTATTLKATDELLFPDLRGGERLAAPLTMTPHELLEDFPEHEQLATKLAIARTQRAEALGMTADRTRRHQRDRRRSGGAKERGVPRRLRPGLRQPLVDGGLPRSLPPLRSSAW